MMSDTREIQRRVEVRATTGSYLGTEDQDHANQPFEARGRREEMRAKLRIAEESLDRGEGIEFSPEMMDRLYESAMRRAEAGEDANPDVCP